VGTVEGLTSPCSPGFHVRSRLSATARRLPALAEPAGHRKSDQAADDDQDDNYEQDGPPDTPEETSGLKFGG
jgi:hypothetical protein